MVRGDGANENLDVSGGLAGLVPELGAVVEVHLHAVHRQTAQPSVKNRESPHAANGVQRAHRRGSVLSSDLICLNIELFLLLKRLRFLHLDVADVLLGIVTRRRQLGRSQQVLLRAHLGRGRSAATHHAAFT